MRKTPVELIETSRKNDTDLSVPEILREFLPTIREIQDRYGADAIFAHGSSLSGGTLGETSDIDLTVISRQVGKSPLNPLCRSNAPRAYITSHVLSGRKISIHASHPDFRTEYGKRPYSYEFREKVSSKTSRNTYVLPAVRLTDGQPCSVQVICPQYVNHRYDVNVTPQTGVFTVHNGQLIPDGYNRAHYTFGLLGMYCPDLQSNVLENVGSEFSGPLVLWGLEAHKALSNQVVINTPNNDFDTDLLSHGPIYNSMEIFARYFGAEASPLVTQALLAAAHVRNTQANRTKMSFEFIHSVSPLLHPVVAAR